MVITCPSCSARYRLNPDKIKGRGAKITCPKCSHVFVVFSDSTQDADGSAAVAAPAAPPTSPKRAPAPARPAAVPPTSQGLSPETTSGAFQAVGLNEADNSASTTGNIRVVAPGPRKTRRVRALSRDNMPTIKQIGGGNEDPDEETPPPDEPTAPRSAAELDFRSVGITTWKVKVSIGLIYDFSDISTLKKYLTDKKVTEDDLISHNAKTWTRIGDIPDLDQHFIETWTASKAAGASGAPKKEKKAADPAATGSQAAATGSYGTSSGTYSSQPTARTGSHRTTGSQPVRTPTQRRPPKRAPAEADNSGRNRLLGLAAAGLLLIGGAWLFIQSQAETGPIVNGGAGTPTPSDPEAEASQQERIRLAIAQKLKQERTEIEERQKAEEEARRKAEAEEVPLEDRRDLEVVRPEHQTVAAEGAAQRKLQRRQPRSTPTVQPTPGGTSKGETKQNSSLTYLKHGRTKLQEGNFGSALKMLDIAISKDASCRECYEARAECKQKMGDSAGAAQDLARASKLGTGSARVAQ